jgi:hypothetical protein
MDKIKQIILIFQFEKGWNFLKGLMGMEEIYFCKIKTGLSNPGSLFQSVCSAANEHGFLTFARIFRNGR